MLRRLRIKLNNEFDINDFGAIRNICGYWCSRVFDSLRAYSCT